MTHRIPLTVAAVVAAAALAACAGQSEDAASVSPTEVDGATSGAASAPQTSPTLADDAATEAAARALGRIAPTMAPDTGAPTAVGSCPPGLLCDQSSAIEASTARFPEGHAPTSEVARLITWGSAAAWHGKMHEPKGDDAKTPVWLVALADPTLRIADMWGGPVAGDREIGGMWFMWAASGGELLSSGALEPEGAPTMTYQSIDSLPDESLPLVAPTQG